MTKGPIVIIEDDPDDLETYEECIKAIGISNELRFFQDCKAVLKYLNTTNEQPFIILSDVNLPGINGLELKKEIQADPYLRAKGIPFVFISTDASATSVRHAHALSVQGYFEKPSSVAGFTSMLQKLFDYWKLCKHINNV